MTLIGKKFKWKIKIQFGTVNKCLMLKLENTVKTFKNKGRTKDISSKYNKAEMAILINEDNYLNKSQSINYDNKVLIIKYIYYNSSET